MMPKITTIFFFIIFFFTGVCGASVLTGISRVQNVESVQLLLFFDDVPVYDTQFSSKRLDMTMSATVVGPAVVTPKPDDVFIRTQLQDDQEKTLITIFFRYAPQHLKVDQGPVNSIVVTLVPGNRFTNTYRQLLTGIGPIRGVQQEPTTTISPLTFSPYGGDWRSLLMNYHGYSFIQLTPSLYVPPFPLTAILSWEHEFPMLALPSDSVELNGPDWFDALNDVQKRLTERTGEQERQYLALMYADLLYRLGNRSAASEQFGLLKKQYPDTDIGRLANFARIVIEGQHDHFYKSQVALERALEQEKQNSPLTPYIRLALAECFLATRQYQKALPHLENPGLLPEQAARRRDIRRGDLYFATKRFQEAGAIMSRYAGLNPGTFQPYSMDNYSLNNYCTMLYRQQRFEESGRCYQSLETRFNDPETQTKALYLAALSQIQSGQDSAAHDLFDDIIKRYPESRAALRAEIKRADLCYLQHSDCSAETLEEYRKIAELPTSRDIAQEAHFKTALLHRLSGDDQQAVLQLETLLRNYRSGGLRNEALALLIDTLPTVLSEMLERNQFIDALSLAQRNRFLFVNDWIDHALMFRLGLALEKLSLSHDALSLFLYLKRFPDFERDEGLLYALTRVSHAIGDHRLVEDFSSSYLLHFPDGEHRQEVTFYLIDSTLSAGHIDRALELLPVPVPEDRDYRLLAASIHFFADDHQAVVQLLLPLTQFSELSANYRLILAESLFLSGRDDRCIELYEQLIKNDVYKDLSNYRLAQIFEKNRNENRTREIYTQFESDTDTGYWHRLFAQQQRFEKIEQMF